MFCGLWMYFLTWQAMPYLPYVTSALPVRAESAQDWDGLIARLRRADGIEASLIGFVYGPSLQYGLYEAVIGQGDRERFLRLSQDEHPVVRCVGLLALAWTEGRQAVPVLRRHLADRDWVHYLEYDIGSSMTVGQFALRLVRDPNCLVIEDRGARRARVPLLGETELLGLYMAILADDATLSVHDEAARELGRAVGRRKLTLDLPTLRQLAPSLADWQIVKAIGRTQLSDASRSFLIACVQGNELNAEARLAAASALTRHADVECARALRVQRRALNKINGGRWGDFFVETLNARRAHEKSMRPFRAARSWQEREAMKDHIILTFACDHPLALDDLVDISSPFTGRKPADVSTVRANSLIAISANLDRFSQPWSTYADTAFKLDQLLCSIRTLQAHMANEYGSEAAVPSGLLPLTEEQCAMIEQNISRFTEPTNTRH